MSNSYNLPDCRQCPSQSFEMAFQVKGGAKATRYMPICHHLNVVVETYFPLEKLSESSFISRANVSTVQMIPPENCPHVEDLRRNKVIPWASWVINKGVLEFSYRDAICKNL